jgi:Fe-S-cluster-containing hydrogenase component 2
MFMQVDRELCAGCGVCVETCAVGAIQLVDQRAVIDEVLCTQCEACMDACPNGAITASSEPTHITPIMAPPAESLMIPIPAQSARRETAASTRALTPVAGAALTFLGSEVAPRLADMLLTVLERRFARPVTIAATPVPTSSRRHTARGKGERRQARYRGGRAGNRNHRERR